jgi:hypothetical protein
MRVGIAYFYRGHYIYSIARTPIEPQPFATKGRLVVTSHISTHVQMCTERLSRLVVAGTTIDTAPFYDQLAPGIAPFVWWSRSTQSVIWATVVTIWYGEAYTSRLQELSTCFPMVGSWARPASSLISAEPRCSPHESRNPQL